MPNIPLIRQILDRIRETPAEFDMMNWMTIARDGAGEVCGTTHCVAGWAIALSSTVTLADVTVPANAHVMFVDGHGQPTGELVLWQQIEQLQNDGKLDPCSSTFTDLAFVAAARQLLDIPMILANVLFFTDSDLAVRILELLAHGTDPEVVYSIAPHEEMGQD